LLLACNPALAGHGCQPATTPFTRRDSAVTIITAGIQTKHMFWLGMVVGIGTKHRRWLGIAGIGTKHRRWLGMILNHPMPQAATCSWDHGGRQAN